MEREPPRKMATREWGMLIVSAALVVIASHLHWWSIPPMEAWGFATGGICVWLVVREHMWNWPIGLANNVVFFALFWHGRLYADMGLQVVYFGLGLFGWLNWLFGGPGRTMLPITRTTSREWLCLAVGIAAGTWALREILLVVNGAAPLADALTTALSLGAQYLLCRKRLENWWLWIIADVIYIPLYFTRGLALTAVLYAIFLVMCVIGLRAWTRTWTAAPR